MTLGSIEHHFVKQGMAFICAFAFCRLFFQNVLVSGTKEVRRKLAEYIAQLLNTVSPRIGDVARILDIQGALRHRQC